MSYSMNKKESKMLTDIRSKYYMMPVLEKIDQYFERLPIDDFPFIFNKLHEVIKNSPDCDLIIYSYQIDSEVDQLDRWIILSLKTSMRERAAQTYKWKLLLEIANDNSCKIKEKYNISYNFEKAPLICFVTVNFYNEINNPQQRGMLKFFDRSFLAKELDSSLSFISPLSDLVLFVNEQFNNSL